MRSQVPAGISHPNLVLEPRSSTASTHQQSTSQGFNDRSVPQNAHQVPATINLTPFDQNAIQTAPSRLALGAHGSNNEGGTSSKNLYGRLVGKRKTLAHRKITRARSIKFIPSKFSAHPSPQDDGSLVDDVRNDAKGRMISSLFENFPYPTTDETDEAANKALDDAIASHKNNCIHSFPRIRFYYL